jgi:hypothetical protein
MCVLATVATASASAASIDIKPVHSGDCSIAIEATASESGKTMSLWIGSAKLAVSISDRIEGTTTILLREPLKQYDVVRLLDRGDEIASAEVQAAIHPRLTCEGSTKVAPHSDERPVFDASGFFGKVFDTFAPPIASGYRETDQSTPSIRSRWTAGVTAQYRLLGTPESQFQLWIGWYMLSGMRTADVECSQETDSPLCHASASTPDKFLYVLEHATTIEAHTDTRLEGFTLQPDSDTPMRLFAFFRSGFVNVAGASKLRQALAAGGGFVLPKGPFRDSAISLGIGRSDLFFESRSKFNRLKLDGRLVFDLAPSIADRLSSWKRFAGASRFFIVVAMDRSYSDSEPDSVQTYVGLDFDLRRVFAGASR